MGADIAILIWSGIGKYNLIHPAKWLLQVQIISTAHSSVFELVISWQLIARLSLPLELLPVNRGENHHDSYLAWTEIFFLCCKYALVGGCQSAYTASCCLLSISTFFVLDLHPLFFLLWAPSTICGLRLTSPPSSRGWASDQGFSEIAYPPGLNDCCRAVLVIAMPWGGPLKGKARTFLEPLGNRCAFLSDWRVVVSESRTSRGWRIGNIEPRVRCGTMF